MAGPDEPETSARTPATTPGAEQPSTPDSVEPRQSAATRPVGVSTDLLAGLGVLTLDSAPEIDASALASSQGATIQDPSEADLPSVLAGSSKPRKASSRNRRRAHHGAAVAAPAADCDDAEANEDCTVCWSAAPCVIFQPCGHLCCCELCAHPIVAAGALCPMCRASVTSALTI